MPVRFGTDGVRGLAIAEVTPHDILDLGRAVARVLGGSCLLVGRDPRRSGPVLEAALAAGAAAEGLPVELLGVLPTPALAHLAQVQGVAAAMVTGSHNPFHDNGVKLFAAGGRKLSDAVQAELVATLDQLDGFANSGNSVAPITARTDAAGVYVDWLCSLFAPDALVGLRVVLDTANGAMSEVAPEALRRLGADVVVIHASPDGTNINRGCGATDTDALVTAVVAEHAVAGLAFDGDGDRVIAVDHTGAVVDGDRVIALSALDRKEQGRLAHNTVVVTVMSNLGFHRSMEAAGIHVIATPVGDRHVLDALDEGGFSLGGEQSGHVIHHDLAPTGDGLLAGIALLDLAKRRGRPLHEVASEVMERFPQVLVNVPLRNVPEDVAGVLADLVREAEADLGSTGRVLVRASGTEPLLRVMVEAADEATARATADHLATAARQVLG